MSEIVYVRVRLRDGLKTNWRALEIALAEATPIVEDFCISPPEIDKELFERARQTVKPIVAREAANEAVSEDVLSFRMDTSRQ